MKLLATSDWHGDWTTHGVDRFGEVEAGVEETLRAARDKKVDAYFFLGDLCDPDSGSRVFRCIDLALRAAVQLRKWGIPAIFLAGNHDTIEDGSDETTLTPLRAVAEDGFTHVCEQPELFTLGRTYVVALPFTASSHPYVPAEFLKQHLNGKQGVVVISHLAVPGVQPGEETTEMPRGREVLYPTNVESGRVSLRLQGHYHRQQSFDPKDGGPPILIPGSLARLTFGEEMHAPSFLLVDF